MLVAVFIAKLAGVLTLLILGWLVFRIVRGGEPEGSAASSAGPRPDPMGRAIMRGFTLMLVIGVASAFAISIGEMVQAL